MRILCTIAVLPLLFFYGLPDVSGQSGQSRDMVILEAVVAAIRSGDEDRLAGHFNDIVELTLFDERVRYSQQQGRFVMRDFFNHFPPSAFYLLHTGKTGATTYALGRYVSSKGAFEVNIFLKSNNVVHRINQIRFAKE